MSIKLYVGNLSFRTTSEELRELFSQAGTVETANVVEDRETGRSRGFGFVEMASNEEGQAAITQFNGMEVGARLPLTKHVRAKIVVDAAAVAVVDSVAVVVVVVTAAAAVVAAAVATASRAGSANVKQRATV
jgi:hypothetical protein